MNTVRKWIEKWKAAWLRPESDLIRPVPMCDKHYWGAGADQGPCKACGYEVVRSAFQVDDGPETL